MHIISPFECLLTFYQELVLSSSSSWYIYCYFSFILHGSVWACSTYSDYPFCLQYILISILSKASQLNLLCSISLVPTFPFFWQLESVLDIFVTTILTHPFLRVDCWCTVIFAIVQALKHISHQHLHLF